jgi:tripartite-type tricarboxylate transporter receptor subunit TctC
MTLNLLKAAIAATLVCLVAGMPTRADEAYPTRTIKLVVGFPAGGPTDIIGRVVGQSLARELGKPVVIENMGGAGGTIAAGSVARSAPDGHTLLVSVESSQTRAKVLYPNITYNQVSGFTFLRKMAKQRNLLVVNPALPVSSVMELIAYAKANPDTLNFGGTTGATSHVAGTIFSKLNGASMTFVSYAGGSQPITDLMTGTLQVGFFTESTVAELVKAGRLKALAITATERSPVFPDVPTVTEAGGAPLDISPWFGIVAPAGLPAAVTKRLVDALDRIGESLEFQAQIASLGAAPIRDSNPRNFASDVEEEIRYWTAWGEENKIRQQ